MTRVCGVGVGWGDTSLWEGGEGGDKSLRGGGGGVTRVCVGGWGDDKGLRGGGGGGML